MGQEEEEKHKQSVRIFSPLFVRMCEPMRILY